MKRNQEDHRVAGGSNRAPRLWLARLLLSAAFVPRLPARAHYARRVLPTTVLAVMLALPLSACISLSTSSAGSSTTTTRTTTSSSNTPDATMPAATTGTTSPSAAAAPVPASPAAASPTADVTAAIRQVIQRANQEQEQALARNDPSIMHDTATDAYYNQAVQDLQALAQSGVTAIHLADIAWGAITVQGSSAAQATTDETWNTIFANGSSLKETDRNVYTLVLQGDAWKIQADDHPGTGSLQPPSDSSGASGTPGGNTTPAGSSSESENWAGYAATGGTFTSVSATWIVPNVDSSTSPAADATWVGIGGVSSDDLIQAGTEAIVESNEVTYAAWIETLPESSKTVPLTVNAGDKVSVSVTQQSSGTWQIVIKDMTSSQTYKTTVQYQSSLSSAEWIEESPTAGQRLLLPLDSFGSISFSGATTVENGKTRTIAQAGGQAITLSVGVRQVLAQTSVLGADGSSFTVTRTDTPAPRVRPGRRRYRGSGAVPSASLAS